MRKGHKEDFLTGLIGEVEPAFVQPTTLPDSQLSTVYLIDAMAFVNRFQHLEPKHLVIFKAAMLTRFFK